MDNEFLETTFITHWDFDYFVRDFSDADFRLLLEEVKEITLELDLESLKLR